ncbi:hypothetical protein T233_00544 [Vagococcus lutrae LBD1]|uniref:Uncharacterized protein n=1 Tax=Vagococcus lutrae LBD1 TaxID=1408226 RepID=V6Q6K9_9ENTE|nr:hypothetical protein T233_00544 [Vagococcus lutrae LBD1]
MITEITRRDIMELLEEGIETGNFFIMEDLTK